jgi:hypothetical protein
MLAVAVAGPAAAQPAPPQRSEVGVARQADSLRDLPLGDNVYTLLETTQPEAIADRFNGAGLNVGEPARVGGFLASWSQTQYRLGEIDITDPISGGTSLLFPDLLFWRQVDVSTGMMATSINAPGLAVTLKPRRPTARWTATVSVSGSGGGLASPTPEPGPPPIAYLNDWSRGAGLVSGPISEGRLGLVAGASWTGASKFRRGSTVASDSELASGFAHLLFTPAPDTESSTIAWLQQADAPFEYWRAYDQPDAVTRNRSIHVQSTWERHAADRLGWRILGGYTQQDRTNDRPPGTSLTIDRLDDGPIPQVVGAVADSVARRWAAGARLTSPARDGSRHMAEVGADVEGTNARLSNPFVGTAGELVNGMPARLWAFADPGGESRRHATTIAAFATDRIKFSPAVTLDAGLRFESIEGSADGSASDVSWQSWLPRAALRWELGRSRHTAIVGGYRRTGNRLNLDLLAFGDPAAATADVTRWDATASQAVPAGPQGPIVARVGPGTGGDPAFSKIDPELKRPYTDEFAVGIEGRPFGPWRVALTGIARRETNLIADLNVGVSPADYSTIAIPDKGTDEAAQASQLLTVYNRLPSSFAKDRYLLTNSDQQAATLYALMLTAEASTERLFMFFGATASAANGPAASTGYGPLENDQDVVGELGNNPNASTYARGRLFGDRAFTVKWTTIYRFPADVRVGAIARYQDGQPYSRVVIAPDLNQGIEAVRAFPNGETRFTFTSSLDLRLQKGFGIGRARLDAILDVYNLLTRSNEVEEYIVTGAGYRTSTALEPLRAIHLGARVTF